MSITVQNIILFNKLAKYTAEQLFHVLQKESHATAAIVLVRFTPEKSKEILQFYPPEEQKQILITMAEGRRVDNDILNQIAITLSESLKHLATSAFDSSGGEEKMANILNLIKQKTGKDILSNLKNKDSSLTDRIKNKMFTFDDIGKIELRCLQKILAEASVNDIALAMKGAGKNIKKAVAGALSNKRKQMVKEEMSYLGPQKASAVETGREAIMKIIKAYESQGMLDITDENEKWVE